MKLTGGLVGCDDTRPSDACIPRDGGKGVNATCTRETLRTWVLLDALMRQKVLRRVLGRAGCPSNLLVSPQERLQAPCLRVDMDRHEGAKREVAHIKSPNGAHSCDAVKGPSGGS